MEATWHPLVWLGAALAGYGLFMRWQPLHGVFGEAWRTAGRNAGLWLLLAAFLAVHELWVIGEGRSRVEPLDADSLHQWAGYAWRDLRGVFWIAVPLETAFVAGIPLAMISLFYWVPRLGRVLAARKGRWLAGVGLLGLWFAALWWWLHAIGTRWSWTFPLVPEGRSLRALLAILAEGVAALILAGFAQALLWCGAYYSHAVGSGRCRLREAADLALRFAPAILAVCAVYGLALLVRAHVAVPLGLAGRPGWEYAVAGLVIATGSLPLALLFLPGESLLSKLRLGGRFVWRTWWRYLWFVFVAWVHLMLWRFLDQELRQQLRGQTGLLLAWRLAGAVLRAWLIVWLVNAFTLYFCADAKQAVHLGAGRGRKPRKRTATKKKAAGKKRAAGKRRRNEPLTT